MDDSSSPGRSPVKNIKMSCHTTTQIPVTSQVRGVYRYLTKNVCACSVIYTSCTKVGDFILEFLREFEAEFNQEPRLWVPEVFFMKKNQRSKISWHCLFKDSNAVPVDIKKFRNTPAGDIPLPVNYQYRYSNNTTYPRRGRWEEILIGNECSLLDMLVVH
jgi:mRNA deadenylase 3'-5' endonuclease subunit Ccr4